MRRKVLFVDDEVDFSKLMSILIYSWGYQVIEATSADEALRKIVEEEDIGVMVLDFLMPEVSGIDLLKKIRAKGKNTPAVFFSAYITQRAMLKAGELKISAFIPKFSLLINPTASLKTTLALIFSRA